MPFNLKTKTTSVNNRQILKTSNCVIFDASEKSDSFLFTKLDKWLGRKTFGSRSNKLDKPYYWEGVKKLEKR